MAMLFNDGTNSVIAGMDELAANVDDSIAQSLNNLNPFLNETVTSPPRAQGGYGLSFVAFFVGLCLRKVAA